MTADSSKLLADALVKARALVTNLERQRGGLSADPTKLPPERLEAGKQAFEEAVSAARHVLASLEHARGVEPPVATEAATELRTEGQ